MATNQTTNYQLNQWEPTDQVLRTDFNADNAQIDAVLENKADTDELEILSNAVNSLEGKGALLEAAIAQCGNCNIYTTSYVGTGVYGNDEPNSLTFPRTPLIVFIGDCGNDGRFFYAIQGMTKTFTQATGYSVNTLAWSGSTLTWSHHMGPSGQMNNSGTTYKVVALLQAGA